MLNEFIDKHRLSESFKQVAQNWYNPLIDNILLHHDDAKRPFCVGINGCQGSGKSTLSDYLCEKLQAEHGLNVAVLSLDDFYLSKEQRAALAIKVHPMLSTRGVPGTHSVSLIEKTLDRLSEYGTASIPRFNKANDDPFPVTQWPTMNTPVDIVLFEGWCWGVAPQTEQQLIAPVNQLEEHNDALGVWRHFVNQQLNQFYQPLYQRMDYWLMLKSPSFDCVFNWRCEQEQKLALKMKDKGATALMSDAQIATFIQYYQRLTEHALATLPARCNCVLELDAQRNIVNAEYGD
ncbi:kinase [Aestuariibacter salexigens]|uniref:kinase n=1 Tax=Aestuariibacter salexigens TaxID=226010 RepID=UPI0003F67535|nr:kinase [Aestuariibacter salexigens]